MKKSTFSLSAATCVLAMGSVATADFAVNMAAPQGRGDKDAAAATLADFQAYTDAALDNSAVVVDALAAGPNGGNNGAWLNINGMVVDGYTITTSTTGTSDPAGSGNGWNSGNPWTDLDPILEGYAFGTAGNTITISGLAASTSAGDTIVLSAWGIGDTPVQESEFTGTYGAASSTGTADFGTSALDATPGLFFTFTADGVTDSIDLDIAGSGILNGFALSVTPVPEPSSVALIGLGTLAMLGRRRKA